MSRFYVIARNNEQARHWINSNRVWDTEFNNKYPNSSDVRIVTHSLQLRGVNVEHGILLSGWKEIPDIKEILFLAMINNQGTNPILKKAYEEVEQ